MSKADRANNNDVPDTHYNPNNLYIEEPALEKEEKCNPTDHSVVIIEDAIVNDAFCNAKYRLVDIRYQKVIKEDCSLESTATSRMI